MTAEDRVEISEPALDGDVTRFALLCVVIIIVVGTGLAFTAARRVNSEPFDVVLVNDTSTPVHLQLCQYSDCSAHPKVERLAPGEELPVHQVTDSNLRPWHVTDGDGTELGCLPLRFQTVPSPSERRVPVSHAVPCGSDYGGQVVTGPDWPPRP